MPDEPRLEARLARRIQQKKKKLDMHRASRVELSVLSERVDAQVGKTGVAVAG